MLGNMHHTLWLGPQHQVYVMEAVQWHLGTHA